MTSILRGVVLGCLFAILTVSVGANIWLLARSKASAFATSPLTPVQAKTLKVGDVVTPFSGRDIRGQSIDVTFDDRPTILYVMAPDCPWCQLNVSNINEIARQVGERYQVVGVSLKDESLESHVESSGYPFAILSGVSASVRDEYGFGRTPQTIVIGDGRTAQKVDQSPLEK